MQSINISKFINLTLAFLWIYQGLIPKLLFINPDEIYIWQWFGLPYEYAKFAGQFSGIVEIIFGLFFIFFANKYLHFFSIFGLFFLFILVSFLLPTSLISAFNPVVMNFAMMSLSVVYLLIHQQNKHK